MNKVEYKDFIAQYTDVYPPGYCQHLINEFERLVNTGAGFTRKQTDNTDKHHKDDLQLQLSVGYHRMLPHTDKDPIEIFFSGLQECFDNYSSFYSILRSVNIKGTAMKMQRTDPGGGYHVWHAEQNSGNMSTRVLVYSLYLNTLKPEEAGETEFLYQRYRQPAQENTMIIWPAAFTHAHRGNVVHGKTSKYIVTGWFHYD